MKTTDGEITAKDLEDEYRELHERHGITIEDFLVYLETDHSELLAIEFKSRLLKDEHDACSLLTNPFFQQNFYFRVKYHDIKLQAELFL